MSDTDYINLGRYVADNMPVLTDLIKEKNKPTSFQILNAVAEILGHEIYEIIGESKETHCVDCRVIYSIITLAIHDPERLKANQRSKVIPEIAKRLSRTNDAIYHYIALHNELINCNAQYRAKFNYVSEAILKA